MPEAIAEAPETTEPAKMVDQTIGENVDTTSNAGESAQPRDTRTQDDGIDAEYDAWKAKQSDANPLKDEATGAAATETKDADRNQGKTDTTAAPADDLTPDDERLLKRWAFEKSDLPIDAVGRQRFLRKLERKQAELDRAFAARGQKPQQGEQEAPEPARQQPQAQPIANLDEVFKPLDRFVSEFGDADTARQVRGAIETAVNTLVERRLAALDTRAGDVDAILRNTIGDRFNTALDSWESPDGVDKTDANVIKQVRDQAAELLDLEIARGKHPLAVDLKALTHKAASLVFPNKQQAANRQQRARDVRRGSAERAPATDITTRPLRTEDEIESDWFKQNPRK